MPEMDQDARPEVPTPSPRQPDESSKGRIVRVREPDVRASAEDHAGRTLLDDVEVFGVLRDWKNRF